MRPRRIDGESAALLVVLVLLMSGSATDGWGSAYSQCSMFGIAEGEVAIWRGEASFTQSKSGRFEGGSSSEGSSTGVQYDETFDARAVANICAVACGPLGALQGSIKSSDFIYKKEDHYSASWTGDGCSGSRKIDGSLVGEVDPTSQEGVGGTLTVSPDGSYQLMLSVTPFLYFVSGSSTEIDNDGCSGRTKRIVSVTGPGLEPEVSGTSDEAVIQVMSPSVPVTFVGVDDGRLVEGRIEGGDEIVGLEVPARSRAVVRLDGSDVQKYVEKTTSKWTLSSVSVCDEVEQALRSDLALLMAFNDVGPMISAREGNLGRDAYENLVDQLAFKIYSDQWEASEPSPPSSAASVDMGVQDDNCEMVGADALRHASRQNCEHDVILESILAHERKHQEQCRNQHDQFDSDSAEALSRFEVEAYCVGIGQLLSWLETNCSGNYDAYDEIYSTICS